MDRTVTLQLRGAPHLNAKPRGLTPLEQRAFDAWFHEAMENGWIRRSKSKHSSALLFVPKKSPTDLRVCIDYRHVNKYCFPMIYAPRTDRALRSEIQRHTWYCKIDLKNAFYHLRIRDADRWVTAFRTPRGLFEFNVLPFGLAPAPGLFQHYIEQVLSNLLGPNCHIHIDDILVHAHTKRQCIALEKEVRQRLRRHDVLVNEKKSTTVVNAVDYCGYHYENGTCTPIGKVEAIATWPEPKSVTQLRTFLGMTVHFRDAVPNYAHKAQPLYASTGKSWQWTSQQKQAFLLLRKSITRLVSSQRYNPDKTAQLITDASLFAGGAILQQEGRVVAIWSRAFTPAERNYTANERELLAVVDALLTWQYMLEASPGIDVFTDNMINATNINQSQKNRRINRWILVLAQYKLTWHHTPGKENPADHVSRRPDYK